MSKNELTYLFKLRDAVKELVTNPMSEYYWKHIGERILTVIEEDLEKETEHGLLH